MFEWVGADDIIAVVNDIIPLALAEPFKVKESNDRVLAGAILLGRDGDWSVAHGVTDDLLYISSPQNLTPVSPLHFLPPGYNQSADNIIKGAFNTLLQSARRHRFNQVEKNQRRVAVAGCYLEIFNLLAAKEHELGQLITVEGDRLKVWFETVAELQSLVGDVSFQSTYSAGTPFTLTPPFGLLWKPSNNQCWVRCNPEKVVLKSGQTVSGPKDTKRPGFEELPAEQCEVLDNVPH